MHPGEIVLDLVRVLTTVRRRVVEGAKCGVPGERNQGHVVHSLGTGQIEAEGRWIAHISGNRAVEPAPIEPEAQFIRQRTGEEMSIGQRQVLNAVVVLQREIGKVDGYTEKRIGEVPVVGAVNQEIAAAQVILVCHLVVKAGVDLIGVLHLHWRRNELVGANVRSRNQR